MKVEKAKTILCRGKRMINKRSEWGEGKDIAMGHTVNKSDVRDPGEALHP